MPVQFHASAYSATAKTSDISSNLAEYNFVPMLQGSHAFSVQHRPRFAKDTQLGVAHTSPIMGYWQQGPHPAPQEQRVSMLTLH